MVDVVRGAGKGLYCRGRGVWSVGCASYVSLSMRWSCRRWFEPMSPSVARPGLSSHGLIRKGSTSQRIQQCKACWGRVAVPAWVGGECPFCRLQHSLSWTRCSPPPTPPPPCSPLWRPHPLPPILCQQTRTHQLVQPDWISRAVRPLHR